MEVSIGTGQKGEKNLAPRGDRKGARSMTPLWHHWFTFPVVDSRLRWLYQWTGTF